MDTTPPQAFFRGGIGQNKQKISRALARANFFGVGYNPPGIFFEGGGLDPTAGIFGGVVFPIFQVSRGYNPRAPSPFVMYAKAWIFTYGSGCFDHGCAIGNIRVEFGDQNEYNPA